MISPAKTAGTKLKELMKKEHRILITKAIDIVETQETSNAMAWWRKPAQIVENLINKVVEEISDASPEDQTPEDEDTVRLLEEAISVIHRVETSDTNGEFHTTMKTLSNLLTDSKDLS